MWQYRFMLSKGAAIYLLGVVYGFFLIVSPNFLRIKNKNPSDTKNR